MNKYAQLIEPVNDIPKGAVGKIIRFNFAPLHPIITSCKIETAEIEFSILDRIKGLTFICEKVDYSKIRIVQKTAMQQLIDFMNEKSQVVPVSIEDVYQKAIELKEVEENHISAAYDSPKLQYNGTEYLEEKFDNEKIKNNQTIESQTASTFSEFHKNETKTYFEIVDADWDMYHPKTFETEEEARKVIREEYQNRSKNDGNDKYWRNRKQIVVKVTLTKENLG